MNTYDAAVIGGGPAGLTASIYLKRALFSVAMIEKMAEGGQMNLTWMIENYPGFPEGISGVDLSMKFKEQAKNLGVEIISDEITSIHPEGNDFILKGYGGDMRAKGVIIATGAVAKKLGIPGEAKFTGRGVSYCATCDAPFYKDGRVAVIGGGDTALEEALYLSKFASRVYLIHRRHEFRGAKILQERVKANEKIELLLGKVPVEIKGDKKITAVSFKSTEGDEISEIALDGIFIFVGNSPATEFIQADGLRPDSAPDGRLICDASGATTIPGLFAAGDAVMKKLYQISTAVGDGANAAFGLQKYLEEIYHE